MAPRSLPRAAGPESTKQRHVEDKVFCAVNIGIVVFHNVTPYSLVDGYQHFEVTRRFQSSTLKMEADCSS
jgi:hypothetical protein